MMGTSITRPRLEVIAALRRLGGIESPSGNATALLINELDRKKDRDGVTALSGLLRQMEKDGWIMRDVRGRRCYEIIEADVPAEAEERLVELDLDRPKEAESVATASEPVEGPADGVQSEPETTPDADAVADAILRRVAQILDSGAPNEQLVEQLAQAKSGRDEYSARLGATVEENQRLRKQLRETRDELDDLKRLVVTKNHQVRGLSERLRACEANLERVVRDGRSTVDAEVRQRIESFMRERPALGPDRG